VGSSGFSGDKKPLRNFFVLEPPREQVDDLFLPCKKDIFKKEGSFLFFEFLLGRHISKGKS
jgi:hypothetical protein